MPKQIRLNAFDMNCVGHQSPGLWTHPDDRADSYNTLEYWTGLARLLERGKFDAPFDCCSDLLPRHRLHCRVWLSLIWAKVLR